MQKIPQIVFEQAIKDFPSDNPLNMPTIKQTLEHTFMVYKGLVCMYYILNNDHTKIMDIQVD